MSRLFLTLLCGLVAVRAQVVFPGKYYGSCVATVTNPSGTKAYCLPKGRIGTTTIYTEIAYDGYDYKYKFAEDGVLLTSYLDGKQQVKQPPAAPGWSTLTLTPIPGSKFYCAACVWPTFKKTVRLYTEKLPNGQWQFVEEGQIATGDNRFYEKCPPLNLNTLYCSPTYYTYRCVAYWYSK